ncbi:MAG: SDR family oxidoreductase, partial [Nitrospinaceae bacterium]|nr:SDR family oxidoreductase [Nitrospinaceae bacterium]
FLVDINEEGGAAAAEKIRTNGGKAEFVACNVTNSSSVEKTFSHVLTATGRIDILVNSAGGWTKQQSVAETPEEEWDHIINLNLKSVFLCSKAATPTFLTQKSGRIINMGSMGGLTASKSNSSPPYGVAKAGVHQLTRLLAADLGPSGVAVNALAPGTTATARVIAARSDEQRGQIGKSTIIGRIAEVDDIVGWILFLASPEAGYLMGQTITVNGGRLMV